MTKRLLTDAFIRNLKPAPAGKRIAHWDTSVGPGFGVRVTDRGVKTFVLYTGAGASKYKLGRVDRMSLAEARDKARDWLGQLQKGHQPAHRGATGQGRSAAGEAAHIRGRGGSVYS